MSGKTFGTITLEGDRYVIDAEPHIMSRVRSLFENGVTRHWQAGVHTHKPVTIPRTLSGAKDLAWLCGRYPMRVEPDVWGAVTKASDEYDAICSALELVDKDTSYTVSDKAWQIALPLRDYQAQFRNMWLKVRRILLADKMGLGKTPSALSGLCEPESRPALVVVPTHLCSQWEREVMKFLPEATVHIIKGHKNYPLPKADVYVTSYNRLAPWQDTLIGEITFPTVIFDEVHELRHTDTGKRDTAKALSVRADQVVGLTGTPIYNYGDEIWSVVDAIAPGQLGRREDFLAEWCLDRKVREPVVLHSFLKSRGLFLRREPRDVGLDYGTVSKHVYTLDTDLDKLREVQDVARMLAISVMSGRIDQEESWSDSARQFDHQLRHATGVAKARPAAEFVKLLCDQGDKVVLAGWHHDVYDVWLKELEHLKPVMFTGRETPAQKDAAFKSFVEDDTRRVLIMSLRCGAGLDGLQHVCNTVVYGELDWSPHVMDQLLMRVNRPGQTKHVQAFFLTVADGSDPFMTQTLNLKRSQHDGLVEGLEADAQVLDGPTFDKNRVREMAAAYLRSIGEEVPVPVPEVGLLADVTAALRRLRVPVNTEEEMQRAVWQSLPKVLPEDAVLEREVRVGKRSRLDFMVTRGSDRIGIECKTESTGRAEVYRQVRRYAQEAQVTALALFAPWGGVPSFVVDGTPVVVVDYSAASL